MFAEADDTCLCMFFKEVAFNISVFALCHLALQMRLAETVFASAVLE